MEARGRLLACWAHSTVAARVEARLATGGMGFWPWIVSAPLTLVGGLRGGAERGGWFLTCGCWPVEQVPRERDDGRGAQPNQGVGHRTANGVAARFACNRGEQ